MGEKFELFDAIKPVTLGPLDIPATCKNEKLAEFIATSQSKLLEWFPALRRLFAPPEEDGANDPAIVDVELVEVKEPLPILQQRVQQRKEEDLLRRVGAQDLEGTTL